MIARKVRVNAEPDLTQALYDCDSVGGLSTESCTLTDIGTGATIFVVVSAFTEFTDLVLTCSSYSYTSMQPPVELLSEQASDPISLNTNQYQDFTFETTDSTDVSCTLEGVSGDADLFLRWSQPPVTDGRFQTFDCSSENELSSEICTVANPGGAVTLYARVVAFQAFEGVVITCSVLEGTGGESVSRGGLDLFGSG